MWPLTRPKLAVVTAYNGPAVLLMEDEAEIPVTARLASYRDGLRTSWRGSITPTADGLQQVLNLDKGRLRLPDGTEADFLRPDTSDWVMHRPVGHPRSERSAVLTAPALQRYPQALHPLDKQFVGMCADQQGPR